MRDRRGMFVCETLQRAVAAALAAEGLSDVEIAGFPCECGGQVGGETAFERVWRTRADEFSQLLVLGAPCVDATQLQAKATGHANVRFMASGFGLFLPEVLVQKYQRDGAYLLTPGWLANWPERLERWGFDQATAEAFFAESCARLVLLDSGTDTRSSSHLPAFAAFVNRPSETVPVGLEMLRLRLTQYWRDTSRPPDAAASGPTGMQSTADHAMIFDLVSRLVGFGSEADLAQGFFALFEMLCAPAGLAYLAFRDGEAGEMIVSPDATIASTEWVQLLPGLRSDCAWLAEQDGFVVRIQREGELLGALLVDRVALPLRKTDYMNLALTILPVLALAIANVRNLERLAHSEAVLRKSEARYRTLFESSRDAIVTIEPPSWRFTSGNAAAVKMFRAHDEAELISHAPWELSPEKQPDGRASDEIAPDTIETALREGSALFEWTHRRIDGEGFPATVLLSRAGPGEEAFLQATVRDNTELKRMAEEKQALAERFHKEQKLAAVGTLACGMGHEINNPIMGIMNYAQLIRDRLQDTDGNVGEFAGEIIVEAERVAGIVRGLTAFAARDMAPRVPTAVSDLVETAVTATRDTLTQDEITLEVDLPDSLPTIVCDRAQMSQVLTSLIDNARDALNERHPGLDPDKTIRITARTTSDCDTSGSPTFRNPQSAIRICVEDRGTGIPPEVREHIFDPFYTTKDRSVGAGNIGKGLGLFVSYAVVQEHGGDMSVESEVGQWARFHVDLPAVPADKPQAQTL